MLIGKNIACARVAHSYFLVADAAGTIVVSRAEDCETVLRDYPKTGTGSECSRCLFPFSDSLQE